MTPAPGTDLGPYRIEAPIGAGGMGSVYRARDTRLDRTVAVKIVEGRFSERFEREAKTIASLNHPHICTLHDVGEKYLVMEYIEGAPVGGPLPLNEVLRLGAQIADALDAAHRKGITHRDLKPGNVLVSKAGAKVIDFGLAKAGPVLRGELDVTLTKALTVEGAIIGTICYMSPEQLQGQEADARSDIFALGCVLYEMLTGKRAFDGKSPVSIMAAILEHEPAPLSEVQPMTPPWLDRVIRRCLRKNPDDRWQSARDVAIELREPPVTATPPPASTSRKWPWIAATALASALAAFAFATYFPWQTPVAAPVRFEIVPAGSSTFGFGSYPQISPDGATISFSSVAGGVQRLYVRSLASTVPRAVPQSEGAISGFFSPDGRWLAFRADERLKKVDLQTGTVEILGDWPNIGAPFGTWGSQGILYPAAKVLTRISASGGAADVIIPSPQDSGAFSHTHPSFLPDGHRFLFFSRVGASGTGLYLGSIDEPNPKSPRFLWATDSSGFFAAMGGDRAYVLFIRNQALMAQPVHAGTLAPTGGPIGLLSGFSPAGSYLPVAASGNGVLVYQSMPVTSGRRLIWFGRKGDLLGEASPPGPYQSVSLSPDGNRAAVTWSDSADVTKSDVWILDLVRKTSSRLTMDAAGNESPVWTPDGEHVTFYHHGSRKIVTMPVAGGDRVEVTGPLGIRAGTPDHWSRSGKTLLYSEAARWLWTYDAESKQAVSLLGTRSYRQTQGQFSPDGHWIAYRSDESGSREVNVISYPLGAGKLTISSKGGSQPRWRSDGGELFYVSAGKLTAVPIRSIGTRLEPGTPQELFDFPGIEVASNHYYDVAANGQRFLIMVDPPDRRREPITVVLNWLAELNARRAATP